MSVLFTWHGAFETRHQRRRTGAAGLGEVAVQPVACPPHQSLWGPKSRGHAGLPKNGSWPVSRTRLHHGHVQAPTWGTSRVQVFRAGQRAFLACHVAGSGVGNPTRAVGTLWVQSRPDSMQYGGPDHFQPRMVAGRAGSVVARGKHPNVRNGRVRRLEGALRPCSTSGAMVGERPAQMPGFANLTWLVPTVAR